MGCTEKDVWNFKRDYREDMKDYDAQFLVEHFELQKSANEGFFYAIEKDDEGRLEYCF